MGRYRNDGLVWFCDGSPLSGHARKQTLLIEGMRPQTSRRNWLDRHALGLALLESIMSAKVFVAAVIVAAGPGLALAETAAPNAAGTATMTTRQTPDTGAGAPSGSTPASSVGGGIIGSDAVHGTGAHEAKGLSPEPSRPPSGKK